MKRQKYILYVLLAHTYLPSTVFAKYSRAGPKQTIRKMITIGMRPKGSNVTASLMTT